MNFDVYTVGGIEYLSQVFKGLVLILGDSSFETFLRLFIIFGIIGAAVLLIWKHMLNVFLGVIVAAFFFFNVFFSMRADVTIIDTKFDKIYVVSDVPFGPAALTALWSALSYKLTDLISNAFHTGTVNVWNPLCTENNAWSSAELDYEKTGYGGFFDYLNLLKRIEFNGIAHPDVLTFNKMVVTFMTQCTMPEIGFMDDTEWNTRFLKNSSLIAAIEPGVNQFFNYDGVTTTCVDFYNAELKPMWDTKIKPMFDADMTIYSFLGLQPAAVSRWQIAVSEAVMSGATALSDQIGQASMIAAMDVAYKRYLAETPDNQMYLALAYGTGRNMAESEQMGKSLGLYAKEVVPMLKIAFESLLIILTPIMALMIFLPGNLKMIRGFFISTAWVYLWDPVLAAINGLVNIGAISKLHTALEAANAGGALTLLSYSGIVETADFMPAIAGYLGIMAPSVALMLVRGFEAVTLASVSSMMASPVMGSAPHVETAQTAATQKVSEQTGKSFGDIQAAQLSRPWELSEAVYKKKAFDEIGAETWGESAHGAAQYNVAQGLGQEAVVGAYGIDMVSRATENRGAGDIGKNTAADSERYFDMGMKEQNISFAGTEGTWDGAAGNMQRLEQAKEIETKFNLDYNTQQLSKEMKQYTPEQYVLAKSTMTAERLGQIDGLVEKGKNVFGLEGDEYSVLQQMSDYTSRGGVVDAAMAGHINQTQFGGRDVIKEGMRVDAGVADGKVYLTAVSQDQSGSVEIKDGKVRETGSLDGEVDNYHVQGSYDKISDMQGNVLNQTYTGLINGREGHLTVDGQGEAVFAEGKVGYHMIDEKTDKVVRDFGPDIAGTSYGLIRGDHRVSEFVADSNLYKRDHGAWQAHQKAFTENIVNETKDWFKQEGLSLGYSKASAGGGYIINAGVGKESRETESYNLLSAEINRRSEMAAMGAWAKGLRGEAAEAYVTKEVGTWYKENIYDKGVSVKSKDFGADAPLNSGQVLEPTGGILPAPKTPEPFKDIEKMKGPA